MEGPHSLVYRFVIQDESRCLCMWLEHVLALKLPCRCCH